MTSTSMVNMWLEHAGRSPLLTAAQEIQLGSQVRAWLDSDNPDAKTIRRGQRAKQRMIQCNLRLVSKVSQKYLPRIKSNSAISQEDLLQEGTLGLTRAVEKFDPKTGYKFSTYAYWWIRQSMGRMCDNNISSIRVPTHVVHTALAWNYRSQGMTIEEFAAKRNVTVEKAKGTLCLYERSCVRSLDAKTLTQKNDESNSLLDLVASEPSSPVDDAEYKEALHQLKHVDGGVINDAVAILELAQDTSKVDMGQLLECNKAQVGKRLNDIRATVREHSPESVRLMLCGSEDKNKSAIISPKPVHQPAKAKQLVAAGCSSISLQSMPEAIAQPSSNGHAAEVDAEALERLIDDVQTGGEASQEAPQPTQRRRRTKAEIAAEKTGTAISVTVDGTQFAGQADHIARLINAMKQVA